MRPLHPSVTRAEVVERLVLASDAIAALGDRLACIRHPRVTHWGKHTYTLVIDGFLARETGDERYLERGLTRLAQVSDQLRHHDGHWIFYPGLLNPANASNNAIDSGAVVDSVAEWCGRMAEHTPAALLHRAREACLKVAGSYLPNTLDKPTNQALWAMTGLASAWRHLEPRPGWRETCAECLERSFADQWADGAFPYLPERMRGVDHPSLYEVSGYYHSRHLAFLAHVATRCDLELTPEQRAAFGRGIAFLEALYGPHGRKSLEVEAKHWYWLAPARFETASAPFDLCAFAAGAVLADRPAEGGASSAAHAFVHARTEDGWAAHRGGGLAFQCRHFWTGHGAWAARALELGWHPPPTEPAPAPDFRGTDSGVITLSAGPWHAQLRARRTPLSPLFGTYAAGTLQGLHHLAGRIDLDLVQRDRFTRHAPGELFCSARRPPSSSLAEELRRDRQDLRFTLALVRDALRVGDPGRAWRILWTVGARHGRFLYSGVHSTFWALASRVETSDDRIMITTGLARADGSSWIDGRVMKSYHFRTDRVEAELTVRTHRPLGRCRWTLPKTATGLEVEGADIRVRGQRVELRAHHGELRLRWAILPPASEGDGTSDRLL